VQSLSEHYLLEEREHVNVLHLLSPDAMNRLTRARILALARVVEELNQDAARQIWKANGGLKALLLSGNQQCFSVGADLNEISSLRAAEALEFAKMGQGLMGLIADFPAPVYAAVSGYCMGGGLDLALACGFRVGALNAIFAHRGAALGLVTGWGGTQRLARVIGRGPAQQLFTSGDKLHAGAALEIGLVCEIVPDPLARAIQLASERAA